jgi:hypothetical protein
MLETAAVVGDSFDPALVAPVAQSDEAETLAAIDLMLAADLIRPTAVARTFRFRRPIVRRVVNDGMPAGWRVAVRARAATEQQRISVRLLIAHTDGDRPRRPRAVVFLLAARGQVQVLRLSVGTGALHASSS